MLAQLLCLIDEYFYNQSNNFGSLSSIGFCYLFCVISAFGWPFVCSWKCLQTPNFSQILSQILFLETGPRKSTFPPFIFLWMKKFYIPPFKQGVGSISYGLGVLSHKRTNSKDWIVRMSSLWTVHKWIWFGQTTIQILINTNFIQRKSGSFDKQFTKQKSNSQWILF